MLETEGVQYADEPVKMQDDRPTLLITTVDIGGGKNDKIEIKKGDHPMDAARAFCARHSLPNSIIAPLAQHIVENLRKANKPSESKASKQADDVSSPQANAATPPAASTPTSAPAPVEDVCASHDAEDPQELQHQQQDKLTFANGMNDKLFEQLSAKLMPVDSSHSHLLSVGSASNQMRSSVQHGSRSRLMNDSSMSSGGMRRQSRSAEPSPRNSVYLRLYGNAVDLRAKQEAKRRMAAAEATASVGNPRSSMSWISQEMMRDRNHGPFENYGEMLYAEGLEAAAMRRSKAAALRAENNAKELEGVTFNPEITNLAKALWRGGDVEREPAWMRLSVNKRAKTMERIIEMRSAREHAELSECTFHPHINKVSSHMMSERSETLKALNISAHEQLFQDAVRRQQKMQELANWFPDEVTFKPQVNKSSTALTYVQRSLESLNTSMCSNGLGVRGLDGAESVRSSSSTVVDRLYAMHEKRNAKLEELRMRMSGAVDPNTGKQLYKPEVGRAPRNVTRNRDGLSIGEYLYNNAQELQSRKDALAEAERQQALAEANATFSTSNSAKLFGRLKQKRFGQIFSYLDEAQTGSIDLVTLVRMPSTHMDNLDNEVREDVELAAELHAKACGVVLLPEGMAMGPNGTTIIPRDEAAIAALPPAPAVSLEQFSALMEEALVARRKPRAYLVPSPAAKSAPQHSFRPAINQKSKQLAARLRPQELATHEILHHNAEAARARKEELRRQNEEEAMRACTFAPRLNTNGRAVEGRALRIAGASRSLSRAGSAAASPRQQFSGAAMSAAAAAGLELSAQDADLLAAVERELVEELAGVSLAQDRLDALEQQEQNEMEQEGVDGEEYEGEEAGEGDNGATPNSAAVRPGPDVSAVLRAQLGDDVHPEDLLATEQLLMELLAGNEAVDLANQARVLESLHARMAAKQPAEQGDAAGVVRHASSGLKGAAADNNNMQVNMFVVAGANASGCNMQDLASELGVALQH